MHTVVVKELNKELVTPCT